MKWFKHMADAHDGNDLTKVRIRYGADGYAVYWYCLELIAGDLGADERITFELRHDAEVIGSNLKIDTTKVEEMMRFMVSLGLFEQSGNVVTCLKLAKYLEKKTTRNITIHKIIDAASILSATNTDKSGLSPLDRDTDTDTDTEKTKETPLVALPDFIPADLWAEFKAHRLQMKAKVTLLAESRLIATLTKMRADGYDIIPIINLSIERGWKGFFAPDNGKDGKPVITDWRKDPRFEGAI